MEPGALCEAVSSPSTSCLVTSCLPALPPPLLLVTRRVRALMALGMLLPNSVDNQRALAQNTAAVRLLMVSRGLGQGRRLDLVASEGERLSGVTGADPLSSPLSCIHFHAPMRI